MVCSGLVKVNNSEGPACRDIPERVRPFGVLLLERFLLLELQEEATS